MSEVPLFALRTSPTYIMLQGPGRCVSTVLAVRLSLSLSLSPFQVAHVSYSVITHRRGYATEARGECRMVCV